MNDDFLRLRFIKDHDGTGELFADVQCGRFSGTSSAWFDEQHLTEFATRLSHDYPLQKNDSLVLKGGTWKADGTGIERLDLSVEFYPIGATGVVGCMVHLNAHDYFDELRPTTRSSVAVQLKTSYSQTEMFANALNSLVSGDIDEAILECRT